MTETLTLHYTRVGDATYKGPDDAEHIVVGLLPDGTLTYAVLATDAKVAMYAAKALLAGGVYAQVYVGVICGKGVQELVDPIDAPETT